MEEQEKKEVKIDIHGNVDKSAIIVGDGNRVNISDDIGSTKTASELAIKRLRQEISELENQKKAQKNSGCLSIMFSGGWIASIVVAVFLAAVVFQMYDESGIGFIVVFTIVMFVIAGVMDASSEKEAAQRRKEIDVTIYTKQKEIQKHKDIVSS